MKKVLYTLLAISMMVSCRSINKMVDNGDYNGAFSYAVKKLSGKKKKKTDHVIGLEKAFASLNHYDLQRIAQLNANASPRNWNRVITIANEIAVRQQLVEQIMPIISEEGYEAYFEFTNTELIGYEASNNIAEYYYKQGENLLTTALDEGDKDKARHAHKLLSDAEKQIEGYKDAEALKSVAHEAGIRHYLLSMINNTNGFFPTHLEEELLYIDVSRLNTFWNKYHTDSIESAVEKFDRNAAIELVDIIVTPEREIISTRTDKARVQDGFRFLKDDDGKFLRDTLGKKIKKKKFKNVYADITEILREKTVIVNANVRVLDYTTDKVIRNKPLSVELLFSDKSSTFIGDKRALRDYDHDNLKPYPEPFPRDEDMIADAAYKLKDDFKSVLYRI